MKAELKLKLLIISIINFNSMDSKSQPKNIHQEGGPIKFPICLVTNCTESHTHLYEFTDSYNKFSSYITHLQEKLYQLQTIHDTCDDAIDLLKYQTKSYCKEIVNLRESNSSLSKDKSSLKSELSSLQKELSLLKKEPKWKEIEGLKYEIELLKVDNRFNEKELMRLRKIEKLKKL